MCLWCRFKNTCLVLWDVHMFGSKRAQYFGFNPMLRETCEYMFQIVVMVAWTCVFLWTLETTCWCCGQGSWETNEGHVNHCPRLHCTYRHNNCGGQTGPECIKWKDGQIAYTDIKCHKIIDSWVPHINAQLFEHSIYFTLWKQLFGAHIMRSIWNSWPCELHFTHKNLGISRLLDLLIRLKTILGSRLGPL